MKKLLIYPYDKDMVSIARYKDLLIDYELVSLIGPKGWGYDGQDASKVDDSKTIGMLISEDFYGEVENCDAVLFAEGSMNVHLQNYKDKIEFVAESKKEIMITAPLKQRLEFENILIPVHKTIGNPPIKQLYIKDNPMKFYTITTPVITVYGTGINSGKFDVQLALRSRFVKDQYKVSEIGSKSYCELFGFSSFPDFMYNQELGVEAKTIAFNHYVHLLEQTEHPDVIIIGVPGGIMPLCKLCNNHFGDLAYIVSRGVQPDVGLLSMHYIEGLSTKYIKELSLYCKYALCSQTRYIHVTNTKIDIDYELEEVFYLPIVEEEMISYMAQNKKIFDESKLQAFSLYDEAMISEVYEGIIGELSSEVTYIG